MHVKDKIGQPDRIALDYGVGLNDFSAEQSRGKRDARQNNELDFEISLAKLVPKAEEIRLLAESRHLISENNSRALTKLGAGKTSFTKTEKNSLKTLFERLDLEY